MQNATNTLAKAKILKNNKKNTFRVIAAFNVTQTNKKGQLMFPVQKKCNYVSSDYNFPMQENDMQRIVKQMQFLLRTNNIMFV